MPNEQTLSFIKKNREENTQRLALKGSNADVDMQYALEQIAGWQAARKKLPAWAETDGVVFPPHLSMEQCSSELTALYKRELALRISSKHGSETLVDLTGGFGVDFSYMAQNFKHAIYVERQERLCRIARHNMPLLKLPDVDVRCADSTECLAGMQHVSMIFVDPARRDGNGGRTFAIADCTPDVTQLRDSLLEKADNVMIKLSPMLDWHKAVDDLRCVSEVHIVSVRNECKELLLVLNSESDSRNLRLCCVDCIGISNGKPVYKEIEFALGSKKDDNVAARFATPTKGMYVYEPNSSVMKAGCFRQLSAYYDMPMVSENSHLLLSERFIGDFLGRGFMINKVTGMNKKELKAALYGIEKANIAVRNFPMPVDSLRKKLKLKDGGDTYIFATTLADGSRVLLITEKPHS